MPYVIAEPCNKDKECVAVCPVDCIHEGTDMFYVNPDDCTDCAACVSVCPSSVVFAEEDVPEQFKRYIDMNREFFTLTGEEFAAKYGKPK